MKDSTKKPQSKGQKSLKAILTVILIVLYAIMVNWLINGCSIMEMRQSEEEAFEWVYDYIDSCEEYRLKELEDSIPQPWESPFKRQPQQGTKQIK